MAPWRDGLGGKKGRRRNTKPVRCGVARWGWVSLCAGGGERHGWVSQEVGSLERKRAAGSLTHTHARMIWEGEGAERRDGRGAATKEKGVEEED